MVTELKSEMNSVKLKSFYEQNFNLNQINIAEFEMNRGCQNTESIHLRIYMTYY